MLQVSSHCVTLSSHVRPLTTPIDHIPQYTTRSHRYITPEIAAITTPVGEAFDDRYWGSELQCYLVPDLRKKAKSLGYELT